MLVLSSVLVLVLNSMLMMGTVVVLGSVLVMMVALVDGGRVDCWPVQITNGRSSAVGVVGVGVGVVGGVPVGVVSTVAVAALKKPLGLLAGAGDLIGERVVFADEALKLAAQRVDARVLAQLGARLALGRAGA